MLHCCYFHLQSNADAVKMTSRKHATKLISLLLLLLFQFVSAVKQKRFCRAAPVSNSVPIHAGPVSNGGSRIFVWRGQVERRRREYRGAEWGGVSPPNGGRVWASENFWFFCLGMVHFACILIRQFTTPVLIKLKPLKVQISSPNRAKSSSYYKN